MATVELKSKSAAAATVLNPSQLPSCLSLGTVPSGLYASCQTSVTDSDTAVQPICVDQYVASKLAEVFAKRTSSRLALKPKAAAAASAAVAVPKPVNPVKKQMTHKHIKLHTSSLHTTSQQPHISIVMGLSTANCSEDVGESPTAPQAPTDSQHLAAETSPSVLCLPNLDSDSAIAADQATDQAAGQTAQVPQGKLQEPEAKKVPKKRKRVDQAADQAAGEAADQTAQAPEGSLKVPMAEKVSKAKKAPKEQPNKRTKAEPTPPVIPDIELGREYTPVPGERFGNFNHTPKLSSALDVFTYCAFRC